MTPGVTSCSSKFDWADLDLEGGIWSTPGGGVEPGETRLVALRRELIEEVGLEIDRLGPKVWTRTAPWSTPGWDGQVDHIHLHRTPHFEPSPAFTAEQLAAENIREIRWWSPDDIAHEDAFFAPRSLPSLTDRLQHEGIPKRPIQVDGL